MLNGRRVDVRHLELAPIAVDGEASKKSVSMVYYENHNYVMKSVPIIAYPLKKDSVNRHDGVLKLPMANLPLQAGDHIVLADVQENRIDPATLYRGF